MGFSIRFGGWRPVQLEEGKGVLRRPGTGTLEGVEYRFEVWHQMVAGFPGPFRSEGRIGPPVEADLGVLKEFLGHDAELELADGRLLSLDLASDGSLLAHAKPTAPQDATR